MTEKEKIGSPEKIPKQKTYVYFLLIFLTAVLIYLYSYPLEINTNVYVIKSSFKEIDEFSLSESLSDSSSSIEISRKNEPESSQQIDSTTRNVEHEANSVSSSSKKPNLVEKLVLTSSKSESKSTTTSSPNFEHTVSINSDNRFWLRFSTNTEDSTETKPDATISKQSEVELKTKEVFLKSTNLDSLVSTKLDVTIPSKLEGKNSPKPKAITSTEQNDFTSWKPKFMVFTKSHHTEVDHMTSILSNKTPLSKQDHRTSTISEDLISKKSNHLNILKSNDRDSVKLKDDMSTTSPEKTTDKSTTKYPTTSVQFSTKTEDKTVPKSKISNNILTRSKNITSPILDITSYKNDTGEEEGYLVYSKNCKIPDIDPMHPSIQEFVSYRAPLNCTKEEPVTRKEGNFIFFDKSAAERRGFVNYSCCYKPLYRGKDGHSDRTIYYGECKELPEKVEITEEFIRVICEDSEGKTLYEEFYSFIHDKPEVEKRCQKEKTPPYSILIVGIDGISRLNMHRQMNKTVSYLINEMNATEMFGFNKIGDNTFPNLVALLMGYDERELPDVCWSYESNMPLDKCNFLWKRFAKRGYRTLYAEDSPGMSSFNYIKKGFYKQPTDYYFRPFILSYELALGWNKKANCYRCVGSTSETEAVLSWTESFASHFKDRAYFSLSWINSMTHDFLNSGSGVDHVYEKFYKDLHRSGAFKRTIVIVMSDHGLRWGSIRRTYVGRLEERLPTLFVALPPDFKKKFPKETEALMTNSRRLVTPFDLHATLSNILHLEEDWSLSSPDNITEELALNFTSRAHTLFREVPNDRSCDDAFIEEHWCTCEASLPMDVDNDAIKKVGAFLVEHLNTLLKPAQNDCASLTLNFISDARILSPGSPHRGHREEDNIYIVVIETTPGGAVFEGTVRISRKDSDEDSGNDCELLGTVSRLNLYGNQSACVHDAILKKYCFCS